ncbi:hypothetical protein [Microvirga guangxiensis]|uniref:Uncharacterized protein n=1 Tax=Microvirga guangxiensis TaxID=549386 RepID=A0A1G5KCW3_9HYPH|nr:hypothetical protein [Microvirga guangxiensis]SCY97888.1 hypothetical protein SAMN02927923_03185 [Microvirga guangxiensis]
MIAIRLTASLLVRCLLAAVLVAGSMGATSMAAGDHLNMDGVAISVTVAPHDCCEPEPTLPDGNCRLICALASCSPTGLPASADASIPTGHQALPWRTLVVFPEGVVPETSSPPPRS